MSGTYSWGQVTFISFLKNWHIRLDASRLMVLPHLTEQQRES